MSIKQNKFLYPFLIFSSHLLQASNIDIPLDSPIYQEVERLEVLGELKTLITTTKPYNTTELYNAISAITNPRYIADKNALLREISKYKKNGIVDVDLDLTYAKKSQASVNQSGRTIDDNSAFFSNQDGIRLDDGINVKARGRFQYTLGENFSILTTPIYENSNNQQDLQVHDTYARMNISNINLTIGREALWFGVGKGGTILLSNNAKPLTIARISNIESFEILPQTTPWLSNILGKTDADFFIGKLDRYNNITNFDGSISSGYPKIFGLQLTFKPMDNFQWGVYRTALFGGGTRDEGVNVFLDALWPSGDKDNIASKEPGDQKGGAFLKLNIPNTIQPFTIYSEAAGEDAAGMTPYKYSFLIGTTLIDIAKTRGLSATYEYFKTDSSDAWYQHHIYRDGYTNNGIIMGHPHGGQGESHYISITHQPNMDQTISFAYSYDKYSNDHISNSFTAALRKKINNNYELNTKFGHTNPKFDSENYYIGMGIKVLF